MQYAVKGNEEQWRRALDGREATGGGMVQIHTVRPAKRKLEDKDIQREAQTDSTKQQSKRNNKKDTKKKRDKK
jgi:hypothetical protein